MSLHRSAWKRAIALFSMLILLFALGGTVFAEQYNAEMPEKLKASHIEGKAALVMDSKTGRVLFEKNARDKMYPASTTKIMTLLLAIEYGRLQDEVTIPPEAAKIPSDSSIVPVNVGEIMKFQDLLTVFMLQSGNDAGNAIAVIVAGSLENFASLMNQRASAIGCTGTNFVNPHGYPNDNHYSTAYDMALIAREAMQNPLFRQIVGTTNFTMPPTNAHPSAREFTSKIALLNKASQYYYKPAIGIKTGLSSKSGECFVGATVKSDKELLTVTLNSSKSGKWTDTIRLAEYGYTQYTQYSFAQLYALSQTAVAIRNSNTGDDEGGMLKMDIVPGETDGYSAMCLDDELNQMVVDFASRLSFEYTRELTAPLQKGDILGTLTFQPEYGEPLRTTLIASRDVAAAPEPFQISKYIPALENVSMQLVWFVVFIFGSLVVLAIFFRIRKATRTRRRRAQMERRRRERYRAAR